MSRGGGIKNQEIAVPESSDVRISFELKIDRFVLAVKTKLLKISNSVLFVARDRLAVIASTDHVIHSSGVFDPDRSRHGPNLSRARLIGNQFHLCKPDPIRRALSDRNRFTGVRLIRRARRRNGRDARRREWIGRAESVGMAVRSPVKMRAMLVRQCSRRRRRSRSNGE